MLYCELQFEIMHFVPVMYGKPFPKVRKQWQIPEGSNALAVLNLIRRRRWPKISICQFLNSYSYLNKVKIFQQGQCIKSSYKVKLSNDVYIYIPHLLNEEIYYQSAFAANQTSGELSGLKTTTFSSVFCRSATARHS